jgi:hypothetical protein
LELRGLLDDLLNYLLDWSSCCDFLCSGFFDYWCRHRNGNRNRSGCGLRNSNGFFLIITVFDCG